MMKAMGLIACLLVAMLPAAVRPDMHVLEAGATAALLCVGGVLLSSLALAIFGAIVTLLVFSIALLLAPGENAIIEAFVMGVALFGSLDATHHRQHFHQAVTDKSVVRMHLAHVGASVAVAIGVAALLAGTAMSLPIGIDASARPIVAAAGVILVMAMVLRQPVSDPAAHLSDDGEADHQDNQQRQ
jgi:hypothetical protein